MCNDDSDCPGSDDCPEAENQCNTGGFDPQFTCCWKAHTYEYCNAARRPAAPKVQVTKFGFPY